jgi:hypothetical protein
MLFRVLPVIMLISTLFAATAFAQSDNPPKWSSDQPLPVYLKDRGTGVRTSIFGTYIRGGELLIHPFFEGYWNRDQEYKPKELGFGLDQDFRGRYRASEGLIFVGYGITNNLVLEFEAAAIKASQERSPSDPTAMPPKLTQSGRGDWQLQLDWRMLTENERRPEAFGYFEVSLPSNKRNLLIGTPDYEFKFGGGLTRGFTWGTLTGRVALQYLKAEGAIEPGEWAIEYLKRVSPSWRIYLGFEGNPDEVEFIGEAQWWLNDRIYVRLNNGFGVTSKAVDWAPDVGVVFLFPRK